MDRAGGMHGQCRTFSFATSNMPSCFSVRAVLTLLVVLVVPLVCFVPLPSTLQGLQNAGAALREARQERILKDCHGDGSGIRHYGLHRLLREAHVRNRSPLHLAVL